MNQVPPLHSVTSSQLDISKKTCYKTHFKRLQIACQSKESKQTNGWRR